ncbi:hypothetical protein [Janibacter limosus]|uniref:hypothetical protein n=1 Tax=Janibacter limosus TaxID=53458 RepID=UPI000A94C2A0|nr:hypothetical protein [Janibacter limosus]
MTGVTHGADAERLMGVAADLTGSARRTRDIASTGSMLLTVLTDVWQGADVEDFVRGWGVACSSVERAADHLHHAADELRRQADDQRSASEIGRGHQTGEPTSPEPTAPEPRDDGDPDGEDAGRKIGLGPAEFLRRGLHKLGTEILPDGLDLTDPVVLELMQTPEGRAWLHWLRDNDITIVQGGSSSQYSPGTDTIYLGSDADVTSLIHEATHAQWDVEGKGVDITAVSRQEYIDAQLDNEVNAMVAEVEYLQATSDDPGAIDDQAFTSYTQAQDAALADGATAQEAAAAGRAAIRELFTDGYYETGNTGQSYPEYYGQAWDGRNP